MRIVIDTDGGVGVPAALSILEDIPRLGPRLGRRVGSYMIVTTSTPEEETLAFTLSRTRDGIAIRRVREKSA